MFFLDSPMSPRGSLPAAAQAFLQQEAATMSWNEAMEHADKIGIEGAHPHRVRAWADAVREALQEQEWGE
jgi:hypothetical protein